MVAKILPLFMVLFVTSCSNDDNLSTWDSLSGTWQLEYYDELDEGTLSVPKEETTVLTFANGTLAGKIGFNTIAGGSYALENKILILSYGITEVGGSLWEVRFRESLVDLYKERAFHIPISLSEDELIFHYGTQSTMHFRKKD